MNRPYPTYSTNPRRSDTSRGTARTEVIEDYDDFVNDEDDRDSGDYSDEVYSYVEPMDRRWVWVAGAAGAILLVAVICTVVILGGGDSGSVSATVAPPATTSAPAAATSAPPVPSTSAAPSASLPAETITTVAPTPSAQATPTAAPPPEAAPVSPRTVTYRVTGTRQLFDLVTIIYTDNQGALQTDVNVALPWTKQIVLDPGVELKSVTATSVTGQLNCSIVDAAGTLVAAQSNNTLITTCTQ